MEYTSLILLHVAFGVLWAGGAITIGFFIMPAVAEAGPGGGAVMVGVMKRKFPLLMMTAGLLVILTGLRLYMIRFSAVWLGTPEGIVLSLGGVFGVGALVIGLFLQRPAAERFSALAQAIAKNQGPPSPEQLAALGAARMRLVKLARVLAWHLAASALLMASHRLAAQF